MYASLSAVVTVTQRLHCSFHTCFQEPHTCGYTIPDLHTRAVTDLRGMLP
jgi:hypothetical protein